MAMRLKLKSVFVIIFALTGISGMSSCQKDILRPGKLNAEQLIAGRLDGIVTPENVPKEIFGSMRLVFTTDESGNPLKFMAQDCPIVFGNSTGAWVVSGNEDDAKVTLTQVEPVDDFDVKVSSTSLTISFYMGWENTDTKATGKGDFKVTLTRQ
jgi:hypothetical protein